MQRAMQMQMGTLILMCLPRIFFGFRAFGHFSKFTYAIRRTFRQIIFYCKQSASEPKFYLQYFLLSLV